MSIRPFMAMLQLMYKPLSLHTRSRCTIYPWHPKTIPLLTQILVAANTLTTRIHHVVSKKTKVSWWILSTKADWARMTFDSRSQWTRAWLAKKPKFNRYSVRVKGINIVTKNTSVRPLSLALSERRNAWPKRRKRQKRKMLYSGPTSHSNVARSPKPPLKQITVFLELIF